jgi:hypothetical protein
MRLSGSGLTTFWHFTRVSYDLLTSHLQLFSSRFFNMEVAIFCLAQFDSATIGLICGAWRGFKKKKND